MKPWIEKYLKSKEHAWAETTKRSELHRLNSIADHLDGNPSTLWNHLVTTQEPYSRVTTWTRVAAFWDFYLGETHREEENLYRAFRRSHARLFKNAYTRRPAPVDFDEAKARVEEIKHIPSRALARALLNSGMRYHEAATFKDGMVTGKGDKERLVFGLGTGLLTPYDFTYQTFLNHLARVELRPHDLRKAFASRLVETDANVFELCEVMGWSDLRPALSYVRAKRAKLQALVKKATI